MSFHQFTTTGSSNISVTVSMDNLATTEAWGFDGFRVNLTTGTGATAANTLTVIRRSHRSALYDSVIHSQPMFGVADHEYIPARRRMINGRDRLDFGWTNDAASFKTWGIEVDYDL